MIPWIAACKIVSTHDLTKRSTYFVRWGNRSNSVSTHDLTKRSTIVFFSASAGKHVSTHDLTKRSTMSTLIISGEWLFQLTTSRRGRPAHSWSVPARSCVSTHDLTKRSTPFLNSDQAQFQLFQLTTSRRGRPQRDLYSYQKSVFQLTTSRRGRQQFLRKKFSFQNHFLCSLHIIYSYYINTIFFSTLFLAKSSFFLVRIL